jgi:hypothetical protein
MRINLRVWENPWRLMFAVNVAVFFGVFLHKITLPPFVPVVGLFTAKVPVWLVFALGGVVWLVTAGLFVRLFRRTFGFDEKHLPLFVFMIGSPFFLKNFMHTLGHFDIYGCLFAIFLLLIPARSLFYVGLATLLSTILVLIHHIHLLMYVPVIATIVVLRYYLVQGVSRSGIITGVTALAAVGVLFIAAQFFGTLAVPETDFVSYLRSRMADPSRTDLLSFAYIWYQPLSKEVADTWGRLPHNSLGIPVFALLIWLHTPLWQYFRGLIAALSVPAHRRIVITAIIVVSLAYLVMFAMVFDYSRWISNWAVCLFLILHAVKTLPTSRDVAPISGDDRKTTIFGWIVTLIPRVGIVRPF